MRFSVMIVGTRRKRRNRMCSACPGDYQNPAPNRNGAAYPCVRCGLSQRNTVHTNREQFGWHPYLEPEEDEVEVDDD